jgi:hypothetical protein
MNRNVGRGERVVRGVLGVAMATCAVIAPFSLAVRLGIFGAVGGYLAFSALVGTCLGYRLIGKATCSVETRR